MLGGPKELAYKINQ